MCTKANIREHNMNIDCACVVVILYGKPGTNGNYFQHFGPFEKLIKIAPRTFRFDAVVQIFGFLKVYYMSIVNIIL